MENKEYVLVPVEYLNRRIDGLLRQVETMDGDLIKELQKLLNSKNLKHINPAAQQAYIKSLEDLLHGFINAYDVLHYDINPELIMRAKQLLNKNKEDEKCRCEN
jgi:hypothetical protein